MASSLFSNCSARRDGLLSIDVGGRRTKAVELARAGENFVLKNYAVIDTPAQLNAEVLSSQIKAVCSAIQPKTKSISLALPVGESMLRHAEMPAMPVGEMRQALKLNARGYLQQDFPGFTYDCFITADPKPAKGEEKRNNLSKVRVLVAGARQQLLEEAQQAIRNAGYIPESVVPGLIGPVNALELAYPQFFAKEAVALVDVGFRSTSISLVQEGQLILSRVVSIGGDQLTSGLAEAMSISYAEAESIKVGIPAEVQSCLEPLLVALGRELRASVDCFEHQQDKTVSHVLISGAAASSELMLQTLQTELALECAVMNPLSCLRLALPPDKKQELPAMASQLTVALGTAMAAY